MLWLEEWLGPCSPLLVSFIKMDGARWPGNTSSLLLFASLSPSIYPSICLLLSPFCFCLCTSIACKIYVSLFIWLQPDVGTEKICNSLSVSLSPYLSPNVFHLGFSISMSMQSLGCQTQLRGHYWQFRACLSVKVSLIFLLSGRGTGRGQNSLFLLSLLGQCVDFDVQPHFQELASN